MKKIIFVSLLILLIRNGSSQVIISGQIKNAPDSSEVTITRYKSSFEFEKIILGKVMPDKDGKFILHLNFDKAGEATFGIADQVTYMYLVPKDSLNMTIDYERFDSSLLYSGKGSADNNYMAADLLANFNWNAQLHREFTDANKFAAFEDSLERENQLFLKKYKSSTFTKEFYTHITATTKYRYIYPRFMFKIRYNPETNAMEEAKVPENYFDFLKKMNINDQQAAENSTYESALGNTYFYEICYPKILKEVADSLSPKEKTTLLLTKEYNVRKTLFKDEIRDYQLTYFMNMHISQAASDVKLLEEFMKAYRMDCKNLTYISIIENLYVQTMSLAKGRPAPEFVLLDAEGKQVALSSLKGKVVYIDFWATWCAPCLSEMPNSHKLSEKFKDNKDVVFLYVNVRDDEENWKKFIAKGTLQGVNLFANETQSSELYKVYNFKGIPHYVLIDKNGNLINADAERPSSIEQEILKALE
ncbi:MAG: TlpA disulfide reductase family protein [bacterium]|nr:TlpA disulfide reductase family protein [bacterium]